MPGNRIPLALQQVFVTSQRGDNIDKVSAPSNGVGFRVFGNGWRNSGTAGTPQGPDSRKGKKGAPSQDGNRRVPSTINTSRTSSGFGFFKNRFGIGKSGPTAAAATQAAMEKKRKTHKPKSDQGPLQAFLDKAIEERGYSTKKYKSLDGGYHCKPTPLQQASYGTRTNQAVKTADPDLLRRLLKAGLSSNPCNKFGESLVHKVCRRGDYEMLRVLLEFDCSLQITDDYGRTPLHDACWGAKPSFETVLLILDYDKRLLQLVDCRGSTPLSYVKAEDHEKFKEFLTSKMERFWPRRDIEVEGTERDPPLTLRQPDSFPIPDPESALPVDLAELVSNGRLEPEEAVGVDSDDDSEDYSDSEDSSDDSSYDSDESYFSGSSSGEEESDIDPKEMAEFCMRAGGPMAIARRMFSKESKDPAGDR